MPGRTVKWYGKLPSLGDFASRRMEPGLLEGLDEWLATGLAAWQQAAPDDWLAQYLACPCWRFLAMPGSLAPGEGAHAGVMMPSLDRVGRYFPFVLLQPLQALPSGEQELGQLLSWLHRLDDLAVDALQEDWPVDRLEEALAQACAQAPAWVTAGEPTASAQGAVGPAGAPRWAEDSGWQALDPAADLAALVAAAARSTWQQAWQGQVWWWCVDAQGRQRLNRTQGLPRGAAFIELMSPLSSPVQAGLS